MRLKLVHTSDVKVECSTDNRIQVIITNETISIINQTIKVAPDYRIESFRIEDNSPDWKQVLVNGNPVSYDKSYAELVKHDDTWFVRWCIQDDVAGVVATERIDVSLLRSVSDDKPYLLYTDGSCLGNPGRGGVAAVAVQDGRIVHGCSFGYNFTTNNRMEILAVIHGLNLIPPGSKVTVITDSQYVVNTLTKGWKRNKNKDLWNILDGKINSYSITFEWVKGHNGDLYNETVDRMAHNAAEGNTDKVLNDTGYSKG